MIVQKLIYNEKLTQFFKIFFAGVVNSAYVSFTEDAEEADDDLRKESQRITDELSRINLSHPMNAVDFKSVIVLDISGNLVEMTMVTEATSMIFAKIDKEECIFIK